MLPCKTVEWLYDAFPFDGWRAWLVRRHMEKCPACQRKLVGVEEARALLAEPVNPEEWAGLRARLHDIGDGREALSAPASRARFPRFPVWAPRAAMIVALAAASWWLARESGRTVSPAEAIRPPDRFELEYIRVGGLPADAVIYQPQGTDMIIVWAERAPL